MINATVNRSDLKKLERLARRYPRAVYKGLGRAGAVMRGKLRKVMRTGGGVEGVPAFKGLDGVTVQKRKVFGPSGRKIGGTLSKASSIQMYRQGKNEFVVGFITALKPYARMLQAAEARTFTIAEELRMRRVGIILGNFNYNRPARAIIEPFSKNAGRDLGRLALQLTNKIIAQTT